MINNVREIENGLNRKFEMFRMKKCCEPVVNPLTSSGVFWSTSCAVGWGADQGVGGFGDDPGVKAQVLNLIRSVRTVMRGSGSGSFFVLL